MYIKNDLALLKQIDNYIKTFASFGVNISREMIVKDINKNIEEDKRSLGTLVDLDVMQIWERNEKFISAKDGMRYMIYL